MITHKPETKKPTNEQTLNKIYPNFNNRKQQKKFEVTTWQYPTTKYDKKKKETKFRKKNYKTNITQIERTKK